MSNNELLMRKMQVNFVFRNFCHEECRKKHHGNANVCCKCKKTTDCVCHTGSIKLEDVVAVFKWNLIVFSWKNFFVLWYFMEYTEQFIYYFFFNTVFTVFTYCVLCYNVWNFLISIVLYATMHEFFPLESEVNDFF